MQLHSKLKKKKKSNTLAVMWQLPWQITIIISEMVANTSLLLFFQSNCRITLCLIILGYHWDLWRSNYSPRKYLKKSKTCTSITPQVESGARPELNSKVQHWKNPEGISKGGEIQRFIWVFLQPVGMSWGIPIVQTATSMKCITWSRQRGLSVAAQTQQE